MSAATIVAVLGGLGVPITSAKQARSLLRSPAGRPVRSPVGIDMGARDSGPLRIPWSTGPTGVGTTGVGTTGADEVLRVWCEGRETPIPGRHDGEWLVIDRSSVPPQSDQIVRSFEVEDAAGERHQRFLIAAAQRCAHGPHPQRSFGIFAPTAGLRASETPDHGAGDLTSLRQLGSFAMNQGAHLLGTLPLTATAPDQPSPYSPLTRRFWDERWVDPQWVAQRLGLNAKLGRRAAVSSAVVEPLIAWTSTREALAEVLAGAAPLGGLPEVVAGWRDRNPAVQQWARWKVAAIIHGWNPNTWPAEVSDAVRHGAPASGPLGPLGSAGPLDSAGPLGSAALVDFEVFAQWAVSSQLEALGSELSTRAASLYLDLPIGVSAASYDVWDRPDLFAAGISVGAPPDRFFPTGQSWGLAPFIPSVSSADGHRYFRECLEQHMAVSGLLRLDHVMGLHRLFWVPEGGEPTEGTYVSYPAEELWAVVAATSAALNCGVVGEDLGTVPDEVRHSMHEVGALGLFIGQDEVRSPLRLARPVPEKSVASLNTHDLETFANWYLSSHEQPLGEVGEARNHLCAELALSAADVVMISEQDLWLDNRRINIPGQVGGTLWRERSQGSLEVLEHSKEGAQARELLSVLRAWRTTTRGDFPDHSAGWLDDADIDSLHNGTHARLANRFGLHPSSVDGLLGSAAAVWAPTAREVQVAGDFDGWVGTPLHRRNGGDVWVGFLPSAMLGDRYKIKICASTGSWLDKCDPFARASELPPGNASIVTAEDPCAAGWQDEVWLSERAARHAPGAAIAIYEAHLGSWKHEHGESLGYRELAPLLIAYLKDLGYTHIELMPIMEHPFGGSWGYHVTGYFSPTSRYGTPADFAWMIDQFHRNGIGVILDWVPAHFPDDQHGLADFDGQPLFEYADPAMGRHPEWGSRVFDVGRPEVRAFLVSSARWWIETYHADGLRVDAVASMLYRSYARAEGEWSPNQYGGKENLEAIEFVRHLTTELQTSHPDTLIIAEESTAWPGVTHPVAEGGLGFDCKWDLGWMHDMLEYLAREPIHRKWHQNDLTFRSTYSASERFVQPLSHDEVVHGKGSLVNKMAGDEWQRRANLRLLFGNQYTTPGIPLLFMGGELAMSEEWSHDRELPWYLLDYEVHSSLRDWVRELNRLLRSLPSLADDPSIGSNFEWIDCADTTNSVLVWARRSADPADTLVVTANFTPTVHEGYRIGLPKAGRWHLLANSDAHHWGGSGLPIPEVIESVPQPHGHWQQSGVVTLAPLGLMVLSRRGGTR